MQQNRRILLSIILVFGLLGWLPQEAFGQQNRPNFVVFIGDDVSQEDLQFVKTPNIDQLASRGLRFQNAYQTGSSCSPMRTSLITGRYPHNTGGPELHMGGNPNLENLPQFPHLLRKAGYYTALAGKNHFNGDIGKSFDSISGRGNASGTGRWIPTLEKRPKNKPFFMWFSSLDAHRGWDQSLDEGPHGPGDVRVPPYLVDGEETRKDMAHYYNELHRYDRNIGHVVEKLKDQKVYKNTVIIVLGEDGRPMPRSKTWLYDSGVKTPFILHWPARTNRAAEPKSLVSWIDIAPTILDIAGIEKPETFQGVSLTPFLKNPDAHVRDFVFAERNWHGQRYHERMVRYQNMVYIRNRKPELTGFNLVHYGKARAGKYIDGGGAYVELVERWKADKTTPAQTVVIEPGPRELLFDVSNDPHQIHNLANKSEYAEELASMRKALDQWMNETGDTIPDTEDMTPDRMNRETWEPQGRGLKGGRTGGGKVPGEATKAWTINNPGPIRVNDVKQ